ncbi:TIM barrel protein [Candidatus Woesearchaeota archaeon]|nr:TIM barrel protein [Candidatus Woesearchaeota archaeon]
MNKPNELRFGTSGIPITTVKGDTFDGLRDIKKLGLKAMELPFVHSVYLNKTTAAELAEEAKANDVTLTAHGSYYINLNAKESQKIGASRSRVLQAAHIGRTAGVWSLTFHAAFYLGMEKETVYDHVKFQMKKIIDELQDVGNDIWIRPETTGKPTQWGHYKEILKLSEELEQVMPCFDFAHLHARTNGKYNTKAEFQQVLEDTEKTLGKEALQNMHIHMSGINYGEKGEKNHLFLEDSDMNYKDLMKTLKEFKVKGTLISESPNLEHDALLMKKTFEK